MSVLLFMLLNSKEKFAVENNKIIIFCLTLALYFNESSSI